MLRSPSSGAALLLAAVVGSAPAAVDVSVSKPQVTRTPNGERFVQAVTFANQVASYQLTYDIIRPPGKPNEATSHWWAWTTKMVTLGMTQPSQANWYFQGFFNWYFDDESLYNRPARMRVVRSSGQDGAVEYAWDTPKATAFITFAMAAGSDKLLMFAHYEPKAEIHQSYLLLSCYPTGFKQPRNRAVTTATRTVPAGGRVVLDLTKERWVLYEDVTEGRPGDGPAGLLIGTPESFRQVSIPVGGYGIVSRLHLKPEARSFALGLYSFPTLPEVRESRDYFRAGADAEAEWLGRQAARGLKQPLPPLPIAAARRQRLHAMTARMFDRDVEQWRPSPKRPDFPWASKLPGGPIKTLILAPRWCAYETMELARRLQMEATHLYFDTRTALSNDRSWPYRRQTGQGAVGMAAATARAGELCSDSKRDLFLVAGVSASAIPGASRAALLEQVRAGRGLLIVGSPDMFTGWPEDLFASPDEGLAQRVLAALPWTEFPGLRSGDPGRITRDAPLRAYRYGQGRVLALTVRLGTYSSLVPKNSAAEGLRGAADRCLALCARAALAAVGRLPKPMWAQASAAQGTGLQIVLHKSALARAGTVVLRAQDDLDRVLSFQRKAAEATVILPSPPPAGRASFYDVALLDGADACLDFASVWLPADETRALADLSIEGGRQVHDAAPPMVDLAGGGVMRCAVTLPPSGDMSRSDARLVWEVHDAFGRLLARSAGPAPPGGGRVRAELRVNRPVTVCHHLDVSLRNPRRELAFARLPFTIPLPYPYDDFTVLMWSYAGGEPVLQRTNRLCYDLGADMMDLCHMGGYDDAGAAREYAVAARSGLRVLPYVTRLSAEVTPEHFRTTCLHDPAYLEKTRAALRTTCRQSAPYSPVAFTLGDENYLFRGESECCHRPESVAAFQPWLQEKYGTIEKLNRVWDAKYADFADIERPMLIDEAAKQTTSYAPWLDHKRFMDTAFAHTHELFADTIREVVPGAKVGWDGLLGYGWQAGYDFTKLCANLDLNETYTIRWLQGELVRSLKRPGALTGKWGNAVADNEAGFSAWPWDCLFAGDNSVWWWTSWGCDYTPFNPDLSLSNFGKWFFPAAREVAHGPGKLLLHATRQDSGIGVLYSQPDMFVSAIMKRVVPDAPYASAGRFWSWHETLLHAIHDLGREFRHIPYPALQTGEAGLSSYKWIILPLASCLSDVAIAALQRFVTDGGTLLVDARAGLLDADGRLRNRRPLSALLGVDLPVGLPAVKAQPRTAALSAGPTLGKHLSPEWLPGRELSVVLLEPKLKVTAGETVLTAGDVPALVAHRSGKGLALTLNFTHAASDGERAEDRPSLVLSLLAQLLDRAGVAPHSRLRRTNGARPLCIRQAVFADGDARYLALQQDLLVRGLPEQSLRIEWPTDCYVYDVRSGKAVGDGKLSSWEATLSRGRPLLYALLPYQVNAVSVAAPPRIASGGTAHVTVRVAAGGRAPGCHVVRMDVFAPGANTPHRQYSQNIACTNGRGEATIPFALSDPSGEWRIECRDVATGVRAERNMRVLLDH